MKPIGYQIVMKNTCTESWSGMDQTEKGRFCHQCQKEVIDFTQFTDANFIRYFQQEGEREGCGRFLSDQLHTITIPMDRALSGINSWQRFLLVCLLCFGQLLAGVEFVLAQQGLPDSTIVSSSRSGELNTPQNGSLATEDSIKVLHDILLTKKVKEPEKDTQHSAAVTIQNPVLLTVDSLQLFSPDIFNKISTQGGFRIEPVFVKFPMYTVYPDVHCLVYKTKPAPLQERDCDHKPDLRRVAPGKPTMSDHAKNSTPDKPKEKKRPVDLLLTEAFRIRRPKGDGNEGIDLEG